MGAEAVLVNLVEWAGGPCCLAPCSVTVTWLMLLVRLTERPLVFTAAAPVLALPGLGGAVWFGSGGWFSRAGAGVREWGLVFVSGGWFSCAGAGFRERGLVFVSGFCIS